MDILEVYRRASIKEVYTHQQKAWQAMARGENMVLLAGTGSGKTEAVLLPALAKNLRVILVYPTKALLQDQIPRVQELWGKVRGGSATGHISIDTGDDNDETRFRADVILTTIDKLLYRVFGYGSARWGYIYPWRIAQNPQKKTLLVFDEAHAYDEIPLTHFLFLIDRLTYEKRVQTAVLSATLPEALVEHLRDNHYKTFPRPQSEGDFFQIIDEQPGEVRRGTANYCGHLEDRNEVVGKAIDGYRQAMQVIIVANRVYPKEDGKNGFSVHELWEAIKAKLLEKEQGDLLLYHGHQSPGQRRKFLQQLQERDASRNTNAPKPYILITTSAFEVGVNVSCDLMFTEVCNPDAFIQRIGRCARRHGEKGEVYMFGEIFPKALPEEKKAQEELLKLLRQHECEIIDANLKAQINALNIFNNALLARRRNTIIYTVDASLYDYVYYFVATGAEIWRKGVLVTRDWVPTIELQPDGMDAGERLRLAANYSVPMELVKGWWFETRDEDGRPIRIHGKKVIEQLREHGIGAQQGAVNACQATLVIWLKPQAWDNVFGLKERQVLDVKREFGGLQGIKRCLAKPLPDAPQLFWFEPEDEV